MAVVNFNTVLSWSQFSQLPSRPSSKDEDAQVSQTFGFSNFQLERKGNRISIKEVTVTISLVSGECWVVSGQMSDNLLKHEQGHYDILALAAREIYNSLIGLTAANSASLQSQASSLRTRFQNLADKVNDRYDTQTNHSRNQSAQQLWDTRIATAKLNPQGKLDDLPT